MTTTDSSTNAMPPSTPSRSGFSWRLALGIVLILAAVGRYVWTSYRLVPVTDRIALQPPRPPAEFPKVEQVPAAPGSAAGMNVLLITLDTTRPDRLGCYGNATIPTPNLDRLAREGVIFAHAYAVAPSTLPAHASILTGLYPRRHEARANGFYRVPETVPTLAGALAGAGYDRAAFVSSYVLAGQFGLEQGFEVYDDETSNSDEIKPEHYRERKADATTDRALKWLKSRTGDRPFFVWTHYYDPHSEYNPPAQFANLSNPYDGEIAFVDTQIGRLFEWLESSGRMDKTLIVAVGDHGEGLGQHGEDTHAMLVYDATLRIPLLMRIPGAQARGVNCTTRVSQVDVMPTLLSLLGVAGPADLSGAALTGRPGDRPLFAETLHGRVIYGWASMLAVYSGDLKYVHSPKPELFDLANDPEETTNLLSSRRDQVKRLEGLLFEQYGEEFKEDRIAAANRSVSAEDRDKLSQLGYLDEGLVGATSAGARPDPKDMMPAYRRVELAVNLSPRSRDLGWRVEQLRSIVKDYPEFLPAHKYLGDALYQKGDMAAAVVAYERCVKLSPESPQAQVALGLAHLARKQYAAAAAAFQAVLERGQDLVEARFYLGAVMLEQKNYDAAIREFRRVLELEPTHALSAIRLARALEASGRGDEVPGVLEPMLARDPSRAAVRNALADHLMEGRQYDQVEALLREGVRLAPQDRDAVANLAMYLLRVPEESRRRVFEGVELMERLCQHYDYKDARAMWSLAAVYTFAGRIDEALSVADRARKLAEADGNIQMVGRLDAMIQKLRDARQRGPTSAPATATAPIAPADAP